MKFRNFISLCIIFSLCVESTFALFSDTEYSWYRDSIMTLSIEGVIRGFGDGTFRPEQTITRAEILKVFLRTKGITPTVTPTEKCFPDVEVTDWSHPYICEGVRLGVIKGFEDGTFGPDKPVTVIEALAIGMRLYGIEPTSTSPWYLAYQELSDTNGLLDTYSYSRMTPMSRGKASELILNIRAYSMNKTSIKNLSRGCLNLGNLGSTNVLKIAGKDRSYILSVPPNYSGHEPVGFIIAIHGRTNSNEMVRSYMGLEGPRHGTKQTDFIVAYPAGLDAGGGTRSWSAEENVAFIDAIIRDLTDAYCIERSDVFLVAHSLGASFASKLACVRGDLIHGMAIVGGGGWTGRCGHTPTASLIYQNPDDPLSSPSTARATEKVMKNINTCGTSTEDITIGSLICKKWKDCSTGNPVIWCESYPTSDGGAHGWPRGGGGDILNFFRSLKN